MICTVWAKPGLGRARMLTQVPSSQLPAVLRGHTDSVLYIDGDAAALGSRHEHHKCRARVLTPEAFGTTLRCTYRTASSRRFRPSAR